MELPRIQVSYASADQAFADQLMTALRQQTYAVYDATRYTDFNDAEVKEIRYSSLEDGQISIFLLSPAALQSSLVQLHLEVVRELQAIDETLYIIALIIAPVALPPELQRYLTITTIDRAFASIMADVDAFLDTVPPQAYFGDYIQEEKARSAGEKSASQLPPPPDAAHVPVFSDGTTRSQTPEQTPATAHTLQFSAYYPKSAPVATWQTLLLYTHIAEVLAAIEADAATFTELGSNPHIARGTARQAILTGVELTIEPHIAGVTFTPSQDAFIWRGDWHRSLFRFSGTPALAGQSVNGWIDIYAGPMIPIARVDLTLAFHAATDELRAAIPHGITVTSNIFDSVFISYSHRDTEAFAQAYAEYQRFGIAVATDQHLAAGADYEQELARMIDAAQVFHLLWSHHTATSTECRKEWLRALEREPTERFIKPWYWQRPLATPPAEIAAHHISFRYQRLKRKLFKPTTWF